MEDKSNCNQPISEPQCENPITTCNDCPYNLPVREQAMKWWNNMNLEDQFYNTNKYNFLLMGNKTRHPNTLTDREIERLYKQDIIFK